MVISPVNNVQSGAMQSDPAVAPSPPQAVKVAPADAVATQPSAVPDPAQVRQAVEAINKSIQSLSRNIQFTMDEDVHMTVVKVVDTQTKEVIRQMPSEEVLSIAKTLDKLQGLLIRQKA